MGLQLTPKTNCEANRRPSFNSVDQGGVARQHSGRFGEPMVHSKENVALVILILLKNNHFLFAVKNVIELKEHPVCIDILHLN